MTDAALGSDARPLRVAVIGSGPSAFYAAEALFKVGGLACRVDMFERLPTPFGLVRGGVAPDHQKIKTVVKVYERIAANPAFRFFGNVTLGRDVAVGDLTEHYDCVVYAVGNESDRRMGVPGEDLAGVHSATEFVGWYNSHPDFAGRSFDLAGATRIAVVGNGNVAMDVARILVADPDALHETDIADYAVEALRASAVREVVLLGRRGPAQAAFSPKEIQEIAKLPEVDVVVPPADAELDDHSARWLEEKASTSAQRNVAFLRAQVGAGLGSAPRKVVCRFCVSPAELIGRDGRLHAVRIEHNRLEPDADGTPRPRGTGEFEELEVQLLFKAVGYRGVPIEGVPFHERWGVIPNRDGRVLDGPDGEVVPGQYVVGWAKRGPTGLIGTNSPDSKATVEALVEDLRGRAAPALAADDGQRIVALLRERGVDFVTYDDWLALDRHELDEGARCGKVRRKLSSVAEMMAVIRAARQA